jgi:hypothetical protein
MRTGTMFLCGDRLFTLVLKGISSSVPVSFQLLLCLSILARGDIFERKAIIDLRIRTPL